MAENVNTPFWKPAFNYGLIMAAVSIFLSLAFYFTDLYLKSWAQWASMAIGIIVLIYLMSQYRKVVCGGFAGFGKMFKMTFTSGMISLVIGVLFGVLMMHVLFPEMMDAQLLAMEEKLMSNPRIPESMLDDALERTARNLEPGRQVIWGIVGGGIFYAIISLIVAAILKKEDPALEA